MKKDLKTQIKDKGDEIKAVQRKLNRCDDSTLERDLKKERKQLKKEIKELYLKLEGVSVES